MRRQEWLRIEAEVDGVCGDHASHDEPGDDEQGQGETHLRDEQRMTAASRPHGRAVAAAFLERFAGILAAARRVRRTAG
ncbi:MAG: hypothetical protein HYX76_15185 [Acidobacteria bacterium]|nr:hypothetical protein [Acidobacteriota bacterium]